MNKYKCEECRDTGYVGDSHAGKGGYNKEYMPCECRGERDKQPTQKITERAINLLFDTLGDCPAGNKDYDKIDCENLCGTQDRDIKSGCKKCWLEYFTDDSNFTKETSK